MKLPVANPSLAASKSWQLQAPEKIDSQRTTMPAVAGQIVSLPWAVPNDERWYVERVVATMFNLNVGALFNAALADLRGGDATQEVIDWAPFPAQKNSTFVTVVFEPPTPIYFEPGSTLNVTAYAQDSTAVAIPIPFGARIQAKVYKQVGT